MKGCDKSINSLRESVAQQSGEMTALRMLSQPEQLHLYLRRTGQEVFQNIRHEEQALAHSAFSLVEQACVKLELAACKRGLGKAKACKTTSATDRQHWKATSAC